MKNILITILLIASIGSNLKAEQKFTTFYYQMKTMFEELPNEKGEIIFLGNSITQGAQWWELTGNRKVKNRGISGDTTDGVLFRLDEVTESNPKSVFLLIGTNDLARGKSREYVLENIKKIAAKIKEDSPKTKVYVQSILPINDNFTKFKGHMKGEANILWINAQLQNSADEDTYTYIDLYKDFIDSEGKLDKIYTNDGLHLLGNAYTHWIKLLKPYL